MKDFFITLLSPCGRIRCGKFWERQFLLALPAAPCAYFVLYGPLMMVGYRYDWQKLPGEILLTLSHTSLPCLAANYLGMGTAAFNYTFGDINSLNGNLLGWDTPTALLSLAAFLVGLLIACSCLAHTIRRLRDTRPGLAKGGLLCLPALCCIPMTPLFEDYHSWSGGLYAFCVFLAALVLCLPSRTDTPHP